MDWEQLTIIAQIATGVATLAVAVFLASQLRQQHRDSEREILYTSNERYTDIMGRIVDPQFAPIWLKGTKDYDSLSEEEEIQFRMWNQISSIFQATNFRAGHEGLERGIDSRIYEQSQGAWVNWPGLAWPPTTNALAEAIRTILTLRLPLMLRSLLHAVAK